MLHQRLSEGTVCLPVFFQAARKGVAEPATPSALQKSSPETPSYPTEHSINKPFKERRRKNVSKTSSGYNSFSSGESDAAEDARNGSSSAEFSPQSSVVSPETPQSQGTTATFSSSLLSVSSKSPCSPSQSLYLNSLRATFTGKLISIALLCITLAGHGMLFCICSTHSAFCRRDAGL